MTCQIEQARVAGELRQLNQSQQGAKVYQLFGWMPNATCLCAPFPTVLGSPWASHDLSLFIITKYVALCRQCRTGGHLFDAYCLVNPYLVHDLARNW